MEGSTEEASSLRRSGKSQWDKKLLRTLFVVNLAGIMEKADEALLPGVYREIGISLHASPTRLGSLTLLCSVVQMLCFPLAAYLSIHHNRANVIALGAILWAIATFFVGASSTFIEVAISRALNGIGLAIVIPAIQSLVADAAHPEKRGLAFGWLQFTGCLGGVFGNVFSVLLAGTTVFGLAGWRASFHILAAISVVVAFLVYQFAVDPRLKNDANLLKQLDLGPCATGSWLLGLIWSPHLFLPSNVMNFTDKAYIDKGDVNPRRGTNHYGSATSTSSALKETLNEARFVVRIPTFLAIVAQGVAGTFPWAALSFGSMWLELIGFSHYATAAIIGTFTTSIALGGLFGGWLGDIFARHLPNTGRIILAQFSSGIGIPFGALILLILPYDRSTALQHGAMFFTMGFLMSWCGSGTNNPIFAEIVPERMRTSIYALDRSFESFLASFAPPLVGVLAEHVFGYHSSAHQATKSASGVADMRNARALGKTVFVAFGIPFTACCLLYSILYWTYPRDRDKARAESQLNAESISELHNVTQGYVSLGEDAGLVGDQPVKTDVTSNAPLSVEKQSDMA